MQLLPTGKAVASEIGVRWDGPRALRPGANAAEIGVPGTAARAQNLSIALTAYN
jgi:hypothetical protein